MKKTVLAVLAATAVMLGMACGGKNDTYTPKAPAAAAGGVYIDMVPVKGGTFVMGCDNPAEYSDCEENRTPAHKVTVSDFSIGRRVVSRGLWERVMGVDTCSFAADYEWREADYDDDTEIQEAISWNETQVFIQRLNAMTGGNYRLPTEAEWEYAARGGGKKSFASVLGLGAVRKAVNDCRRAILSVFPFGAFMVGPDYDEVNELGIHGMGRSAEYVNDRYGPYGSERQADPAGPPTGGERVKRRGGSHIRYSVRVSDYPGSGSSLDRFRLATGPAPKTPPDEPPEVSPFRERCRADDGGGKPNTAAETARRRREEVEKLLEQYFVPVEGGTFTMGCTTNWSEHERKMCGYYEQPEHSVTLSGFLIGRHEMTQRIWKLVMGNNPSESRGDDFPVTNVSWNDIQVFISRLNAMTGGDYRLPTEAEWDFAGRGGNKSEGYKYSGGDEHGDVAWYSGNSGYKIHPVATRQPNELGIYDMAGNVREWVSDRYAERYDSSPAVNPAGPSAWKSRWIDMKSDGIALSVFKVGIGILTFESPYHQTRVVRGGSYGDSEDGKHNRSSYAPDDRRDYVGFRLARRP